MRGGYGIVSKSKTKAEYSHPAGSKVAAGKYRGEKTIMFFLFQLRTHGVIANDAIL